MVDNGVAKQEELDAIYEQVEQEVLNAIEFGKRCARFPHLNKLMRIGPCLNVKCSFAKPSPRPREEMQRDSSVFLIGEDVGPSGGIFKCCEGLSRTVWPTAGLRRSNSRSRIHRPQRWCRDDADASHCRTDVWRLRALSHGSNSQSGSQDSLYDRRPVQGADDYSPRYGCWTLSRRTALTEPAVHFCPRARSEGRDAIYAARC